MPRSQRYIYFEGTYAKDVLGIFTIIRGFADLRDLARVSVPYEMVESTTTEQVIGHQRKISEEHAQDIKNYLEKSDTRFFPEVILSVRTVSRPELYGGTEQVGIVSNESDGIEIKRKYSSRTLRVHQIKIDSRRLEEIRSQKLIRRIDGNHRLWQAKQLREDLHVPNKYLAPFCMIIQKPPDDTADDYAESKIFNIINSKALPLESEHALKLLLGQDQEHSLTPQQEFDYDPALYLTRLLRDKIRGLSTTHRERLGDRPLTSLNDTARALIELKNELKENRDKADQYADDIFAAITEFLTRLWHSYPNLCKAAYFIELSACVWAKYKTIADNSQRINVAVEYLKDLGDWLGEEGFMSIDGQKSFAQQLLNVYESVRSKIPKRVFLARWYPSQTENADAHNKSNLRLEQIKETLRKIKEEHTVDLELIDLATETGGTYLIHPKMYGAIESSDIIIVDLTGHRPNVYAEAGYALKYDAIRSKLLFLFEPESNDDKVNFDLSAFRYEEISQAAEIPNKLKPHIEAILKKSGANI